MPRTIEIASSASGSRAAGRGGMVMLARSGKLASALVRRPGERVAKVTALAFR
jgi:hypothetical protein